MNGKCLSFIFRDGYYHPQVNCYYQCWEEKEVLLSECSGLTCSHLILNASQKQGTFSNLSLYILGAESAPVQKGCAWGQWDAAGLFLLTLKLLGSQAWEWSHLEWRIAPFLQRCEFLCEFKHWQWWGKQQCHSSGCWQGTEVAKASTGSQWSVNRHGANFSCFLCLVKFFFSFKLRILQLFSSTLQLFSSTITWKNTSNFKRTVARGDAKCYMAIKQTLQKAAVLQERT